MDKKNIVIVTGTGGSLGTGHIQRMINLAVHLNLKNQFSASIYTAQNGYPFPEDLKGLLVKRIPSDTHLIIRDMRDSSEDEIRLLKKTAPVITVDDSGPGREFADFRITLLPVPSENLVNVHPDKSLFLYGYNFAEGITLLKEKESFKRDIDVTIYAGYNPSPELISSIVKSIPESAVSVLLNNGKAESLSNKNLSAEISYPEIITRTKIIITHFGLTMFEADTCGCRIAALNPTEYHSRLTGIVKNDFNIIYSSEYNLFYPIDLYNIIKNELGSNYTGDISISDIIKKIENSTDNFINYILKILYC